MQAPHSTAKSQRETPPETASLSLLLAGMFGLVCTSASTLFPSHSAPRELLMLIGSVLIAARNFRSYLFPALVLITIMIVIGALCPIRGGAVLLLIGPVALVAWLFWLRERRSCHHRDTAA